MNVYWAPHIVVTGLDDNPMTCEEWRVAAAKASNRLNMLHHPHLRNPLDEEIRRLACTCERLQFERDAYQTECQMLKDAMALDSQLAKGSGDE